MGKRDLRDESLETRLMRYFMENPDEELSYADIALKFGVAVHYARDVVNRMCVTEGMIESVHVIRLASRGVMRDPLPVLPPPPAPRDDFRATAAWWNDLRAFIAELPRLLTDHPGCWALTRDGAMVAVFTQEALAHEYAALTRGFRPYHVFLVKPMPGMVAT